MGTKEKLKDQIGYLCAKGLIFLFERISLPTSLRIGEFLGRAVFYFSPKRRVAYNNLKMALGEQLSRQKRWRVTRDHFGHAGQSLVEVMSFRRLGRDHIEKNIKIHSLERFESLLKSGQGGILITGHFGNWELLQTVAGLRGSPIHVLAADQKYPKLDELLNQLREIHGAVAVSRGAGVRSLIRALRQKQLIGVLGDQSAGKSEGIILPFFGRKTTVPTGAFELAHRTGALILPCFMARTDGIRHEIFVEEPLKDDPSLEPRVRVEYQVRQYLKILEDFIRRFPDQWLWGNKRWKYSWSRKILILSDGKAGHFKQSETVTELLSSFKEFHGRPGLEFETERIQVEYRSPWRRRIFFLLAFLMRPWIQGRLHWLRPFFTEGTMQAVEKANADFIIAAGSGLAPLQMCLARETGAKKIVIMKPPFPYSVTHYDLAVVPAHDGGVVPRNTFRSIIMPSGYQSHDRGQDVEELKKKLGETKHIKMAFFIGGATRDFSVTVSDAEKICSSLKRAAPRCGEFLVTTSRRTPKPVESFLKTHLAQNPACRLLVIASEENPPWMAGGMMGLADLLIVTEDSLAMISEAAGMGKRVIVVSLGEGELPDKHYRFHKILHQRGLVTISCLEDLEKNMVELLRQPAFPVIQREKKTLVERLETLI